MKNKRLKTLAIIIPISFIGIMIYLFINFQNKQEKVETLQNIPSFSVTDINGKIITQKISTGNKLLVYFDTQCEFCHAEMEALSKINHLYKDIKWIMFSSQNIEEIRKFAIKYSLQNSENIKWCTDPKSEVYSKFAMKGIPYFLGYNSQNKLVHRSTGAINIEKVLASFDEKK
ncbi:TlpA family protein disulfide reductase [Chryseobacterium chendengshani]|uniref:TlpA family protein disulfide reductase n=1 Tax=Chryseobacterium sp. LJ756 TaxID=2864113 RepID=UPI001C63CA9E|nr:redoxin domain-containing protein [Chryseobacterium sp. LJ756]MBW7675814.1 redoxin domain-containing protein [Chryseobacterium sp. LJ756]